MTTLREPMHRISLRRLLAVLALSGSPGAANAARPPSAELDADLPIDREHLDPCDASAVLGRQLAFTLAAQPPLEATHLASTWALSDDPIRRAAIAHALEWAFPLVGADIVLDHLARDRDALIRAAVARAAWVRRPTLGTDIVDRLALDADPDVRAIARRPGRG
jgi:hypothetical protein